MVAMDNEKDWFASAAGRRITVIEMASLLDVSRNTARTRLDEGLTSDEIITVARKLNLNPVMALEELEKLTIDEIWGYLEAEGKLVATADDGELALELARRLNPATKAPEIDELAARRSNKPASHVDTDEYDDGTVRDFDYSEPYAADSSPDEQAEREKRGEDPID